MKSGMVDSERTWKFLMTSTSINNSYATSLIPRVEEPGKWTGWQAKGREGQKKMSIPKPAKGESFGLFVCLFLTVDLDSRGHYRYQVHEKIQSFMVPIPLAAGAWHEAQIDELFASLLGKGFEMGDNDEDIREDIPPSVGPALELSADALRGFKIFG
jgi:hypothetical protein